MAKPNIIQADLTWIDGRFVSGAKIVVEEHGRIASVGPIADTATKTLMGHAIIPGMVNAHSHAFQRGLRGKGELFPTGAGTFWSWRDAMYELVAALDTPTFDVLCEHAFREMLASGITSVGEFHYMHHVADNDFQFDKRVLDAAARAGIRIVLLNAYYQTGGIKRPLGAAQHRFETPSLKTYWAQMSELEGMLRQDTQSLGVVAHSIRAVPLDVICALHEDANSRHLPFHMHVEEQRREIEECRREYGIPPLALLNRETGVKGNFAAVHCTHSRRHDLEAFLAAGGHAVVCPLTEANLGDGIPASTLFSEPQQVGLGTDSNARISMVEEMRWLEYGQRLSRETRGAIRDRSGEVAAQLFRIATSGGATTLHLEAGEIRPGAYADLVAIDLNHPTLAHVDAETLLAGFIFGSGNEAIGDVCVGGHWLGIRPT